jgi:hypothetical protein
LRRGRRLAALLLFLPPALAPPTAADEPPSAVATLREGLRLSGSLRGSYWSSSRTLDDGEHFPGAALWLKAAPRLGADLSLTAEGWVRNADLFRAEATDGALREAYLDWHAGPLDLRVGRQIVAWGRADRINPTDNLTPRDFTLLVPEDDDQRLGVAGVKASLSFAAGVALTGLWLPEFEPHTIPLRETPGVTIRDRAPRETVGRWALKLEQTGGAVDWSLSFLDGFDLVPDFAVDRVGVGFLDVVMKHHRIRVVGADAATTLGRFGLRGEAAYTFTEDPRGDKPHVKNPFFFLVLGADRTFGESLNLNLQYLFRHVVHHRSPVGIADPVVRAVATDQALVANELDEIQHGASLRMSRKWLNETLETEVQGVLTFTRLDFVVRPKVTYALTDRWRLTAGADVFRGERRSFFGRLRDNTTAYAEVRWSF